MQPVAETEIERAYLYLRNEASLELADHWFNAVVDAMVTLEEMPRRCPIAPEDEVFAEEIRHLLIRPFRIVFTVRGSRVHILHVRHMSQQLLSGTE